MQKFSSFSESNEMGEVATGSVRSGAATASLDAITPSPVDSLSSKHQVSPAQVKPDERNTPPPSTTADKVGRYIVISPEKKRIKALAAEGAPEKHINPHLRLAILGLTIMIVFGVTLITLFPIYADQNNLKLPSGLSTLVQSVQHSWPIQSYQQAIATAVPTTAAASANTYQPAPPLPRSQYVAMAEQDASAVGISPTYFVNQINLESGFNPNAGSPSGAEGIAQFMPGTAAGLGIDPWNPVQALNAAAHVMANAYHTYGDYAKALGAYNAGSGTLQNAVNSCGAKWLSCMPAQTQNYVAIIMGS